MAKTLQELRKEKGYSSAKEFAKAIGMSESSYSRYEADPSNINMKAAIKLADFLGCSIDMIMGRDPINVEDMRGDVQKFYDALSNANKKLFDEFCAFLTMKEKDAAEQRRLADEEYHLKLTKRFERYFLKTLAESDIDEEVFESVSQDELRREFKKYVISRVSDEINNEVIDELAAWQDSIMADYIADYLDENEDSVPEEELQQLWLKDANKIVDQKKKGILENAEERKNSTIQKIMNSYDKLHPREKGVYEYYLTQF